MLQNKRIALCTRTASAVFVLVGILSMGGLFRGEWRWSTFMFYTTLSNALVLVMFVYLAFSTAASIRRDGAYGPLRRGASFEMVCMADIILTFVVYWVLLAPTFPAEGRWRFDNLAVHGVTPLLCVADYVLYTPPDSLKYRDVYGVLIFPLLYFAETSVAGFARYVYAREPSGRATRFPYFFLDYDRIGVMVFANVAVLLLVFLALSHALYFLNRRPRKPARARGKG